MRTAPVTAEVYPGRPQPPRRATHAPSARTRLSNSALDSRIDAASSLRAPGPEDQTALDARAALAQEKCGPDRRAPDRAPTRSDAPPSAPAAPPSAPAAQSGPAAALSPRRLRLGLLADGRLQRARIWCLRTLTRGICRRVTGVFSAPTRGLSAGGFPRTSFCTSTSVSTTPRSALASSTFNDNDEPFRKG